MAGERAVGLGRVAIVVQPDPVAHNGGTPQTFYTDVDGHWVDDRGRLNEWRATGNSKAIVISDRAVHPTGGRGMGGSILDHEIRSLWDLQRNGRKGVLTFNDGPVAFNNNGGYTKSAEYSIWDHASTDPDEKGDSIFRPDSGQEDSHPVGNHHQVFFAN